MEIQDNGEGISQENLPKIFDPFFTTKEEGKGVGLGLTVVYGIVAAHGGEIEVQSQIGEGTLFRVILPLQKSLWGNGRWRDIGRKQMHCVARVYLSPLGKIDEQLIAAIEGCIEPTFGLKTHRLRPQPEPVHAYDAGRRQYSSTLILMDLVRLGPDDGRILGVTEHDLFIPTLNFVFGQAQLGGGAALVSIARLRQEFYQLPPNAGLLQARARKESIHEMGHAFGLTHCRALSCPMSISTSVHQVDIKSQLLCGTCAILLREVLESEGYGAVTPIDPGNNR